MTRQNSAGVPLLVLAGGRCVPRPLPAYIMGIVNATPDSFWEKSRVPCAGDRSGAVERALALVEDGCDILDIGAESTRPGWQEVPAEEEMARLVPLVADIRRYSTVPISVDTRKLSVMREAWNAGADILNDVSALEDDPDLAQFAAHTDIPVVLMHRKGIPQAGQDAGGQYTDPASCVLRGLLDRAAFAERAGIKKEKIILDPGIGFGKQYEDNRALIRGIGTLVNSGYPVLLGVSRKRCIGTMTGRDVPQRLAGTLAAEMYAVLHGAAFVRVHDVRETRDMLAVVQELTDR